jgi:hypothetical protein
MLPIYPSILLYLDAVCLSIYFLSIFALGSGCLFILLSIPYTDAIYLSIYSISFYALMQPFPLLFLFSFALLPLIPVGPPEKLPSQPAMSSCAASRPSDSLVCCLLQSRMRRPTVSGAVLEAPEVAHVPLGLVGTARSALPGPSSGGSLRFIFSC